MAKKATGKQDTKSGGKSGGRARSGSGTAVARVSSSGSRGGGGSATDGMGDAFIKLLQSPLVAELVAVAEAVERANWLAPGGWMSIETGGDPVEPGSLEIDTVRDIGRARITLLRRP